MNTKTYLIWNVIIKYNCVCKISAPETSAAYTRKRTCSHLFTAIYYLVVAGILCPFKILFADLVLATSTPKPSKTLILCPSLIHMLQRQAISLSLTKIPLIFSLVSHRASKQMFVSHSQSRRNIKY